jgi:hypothetical protein
MIILRMAMIQTEEVCYNQLKDDRGIVCQWELIFGLFKESSMCVGNSWRFFIPPEFVRFSVWERSLLVSPLVLP